MLRQGTTQHDMSERSNLPPLKARSVKRQPASHYGSGKPVRAAHCSSRVVWFQWTGLSARRLQDWKAGVLSSGTIPRNCMVSSRATVCGDACSLTRQTITSRNRANSTSHGARSVKRQPALALRQWKTCPRCALLKSSVLVPADRVVAAEVTGLERRCIEQWHDFSELHSQ